MDPERPSSNQVSSNRGYLSQIFSKKYNARKIFDELDTNQDGKLNPKELESLITAKTSSHDLKNVDAAVLARHLIKCADENDDELLDFEEFYKIYCDENFWIKGKLVSYIDSFEPSGFQDRAIVRNKKICKPAFGIILLSFVQFIFYVIDYWQISNKEAKLTDIFRFQPYCKKTEIWRYFTYMFVHDQKDKLHLTINLVIQLIVGFPLEMIHGWWRILVIYLSGVLAGSFSFAYFSECGSLVGASAGVYGLMAAHISSSLLNRNKNAFVHMFIIIAYFLIDITLFFTAPQERTSYVSHAFGAAAGLLIGLSVLKTTIKDPDGRKKLWIAAVVYQISIFIMILYVFIRFSQSNLCVKMCKVET